MPTSRTGTMMHCLKRGYQTVTGWLGVAAGAALPVGLVLGVQQVLLASLSDAPPPFWPAAAWLATKLLAGGLALVLAGKLLWRALRPDEPWRAGWRAGWSLWRWIRFLIPASVVAAVFWSKFPPSGWDVVLQVWCGLTGVLILYVIVVFEHVVPAAAGDGNAYWTCGLRVWCGLINRPTSSILRSALLARSSAERLAAADLLSRRPRSPENRAALEAAAADEDECVAEQAALALVADLAQHGTDAVAAALYDPRRAMRLAAAKRLDADHEPRALAALLQATASEDAGVREAATHGLQFREDSRALAWMHRACSDPSPAVRRLAHRSLALGDDADAAYLVAGLADDDPEVRREALHGLQWADTRAPAAYEALLPLCSDPDPEVRGPALMALGQHGGKRAGPVLLAALDSPVEEVAWHAIHGLLKARYRPAAARLASLLEEVETRPRDMIDAACEALAEFGEPGVCDLLLDFLLRHPHHGVGPARAIAQHGGPEAIDALCRALDAGPASRDDAMFGLLWMRDPSVEPVLRQRLKQIPSGYRDRANNALRAYAAKRTAESRQLSRAAAPTALTDASLSRGGRRGG